MARANRRALPLPFGILLLALAACSAVVLAGVASASPPKPFKARIAPASAAAGSTGTYTYTITNLTNQGLGSANVAIPSGWTVTGIVGVTASGGKLWNATLDAGVIKLRNDGPASTQRLAQNQSVTVTFTAAAPCSAPANDDWTPVVKQSNNFNGSGNDFVLDAAQSDIDVTLTAGSGDIASVAFDPIPDADPVEEGVQVEAGVPFAVTVRATDVCGNAASFAGTGTLSGLGNGPDGTPPSYGGALTFVNGVATASVTATQATPSAQLTMTSGSQSATSGSFEVEPGPPAAAAFVQQPTNTEFGQPITPSPSVAVEDQFGNPVEDGTSVAVTLDPNSFGGLLDGTTTQPTGGGTATFPALDIDEVGIGYTLTATAGGASATSDPFDIVTVAFDCSNHSNEPCEGTTGADTSPAQTTNATVFAPAGGEPGTLEITLVDVTPGACPDGTGSAVVVVPPSGHGPDNPIRVILEYDKSITKGIGVHEFEFCVQKSIGGPFVDPVPDCRVAPGTFPCIDRRRRDAAGDLVVDFLVTDDPIFAKK